LEQREEFDLEDNKIGLLDEDDDTRSIVTAIPHELERVDEDQFVNEQHEQFDEPELVQPLEDDVLRFVDQDLSSLCNETTEEEGKISMLEDHIHLNLLDYGFLHLCRGQPFLRHYHTSLLQSFRAPQQMMFMSKSRNSRSSFLQLSS
jgi:hypothetical protein